MSGLGFYCAETIVDFQRTEGIGGFQSIAGIDGFQSAEAMGGFQSAEGYNFDNFGDIDDGNTDDVSIQEFEDEVENQNSPSVRLKLTNLLCLCLYCLVLSCVVFEIIKNILRYNFCI